MRVLSFSPHDLTAVFKHFEPDRSDRPFKRIHFFGSLFIYTPRLISAILIHAPDPTRLALFLSSVLLKDHQIRQIARETTKEEINWATASDIAKLVSLSDEIQTELCDWSRLFVASVLIPLRERRDHCNGVLTGKNSPLPLVELRNQLIARDGPVCVIKGAPTLPLAGNFQPDLRMMPLIPLHLSTHPHFSAMASLLTNKQLKARNLSPEDLLSPKNWILLDRPHIPGFVQQVYGIRARKSSKKLRKYTYHVESAVAEDLNKSKIPQTSFGSVHLSSGIPLPDPEYLNYLLAIARISHASGAADVMSCYISTKKIFLNSHSFLNGSDISFRVLENELLPFSEYRA
ncbi:uncharacterized protein V2V93DRAFT_381231 [Kockiozyma suomiensis]|uniref:uncharacterized protein n=1 Tax=Kockiozyma suomiensis TaxID=1337062 RepID=UPI00334420F8